MRLLKTLQNRRIFLFGTAGFGGSEAYFQRILDNAQRSIDPSNTVIGTYMCQGRMPQTVRERYVKMKGQPEHPANLDALIENFDRALSHPDGGGSAGAARSGLAVTAAATAARGAGKIRKETRNAKALCVSFVACIAVRR